MDDNRRKRFEQLFADDPLNLLSVEPKISSSAPPEHARLIEQFQEIVQFYEETCREPSIESSNMREFMLASRLNGIKNAPEKVKVLLPYDLYNLLKSEETKSFSIDEILNDDPLGLLNMADGDDSIFTLKHVSATKRIRPDYIAHRRICKNFKDYEFGFEQIRKDLETGRRKLIQFKGKDDLVEGNYYVLRGVILYLERDDAEITEKTYNGEIYRRKDGRTRCIFDNGTESNMLFRSLTNAMREDGFGISELRSEDDRIYEIDENDVQNGYIYVLRSLSRDPQIRKMKNLYKIGRCGGAVTTRIQNAVNEPTYLMSDVEIVLTVRCYNLSVENFEASIHQFFGECNVQFQIQGLDGQVHYPREWFVAPLNVIEEAIGYIVDGTIEKYKYEPNLAVITQK